MLEQIRLPFWYGGPQYEIVEAGFGPYALSRLATATGGIYFITRFDTRRMGFDPGPDAGVPARLGTSRSSTRSRSVDSSLASGGPHRRADHAAKAAGDARALLSAGGRPRIQGRDGRPTRPMAERTAYTVDEALGPIIAVAKLRDRETSRRWQAHYDLIRGRLLAMKVRCYEYNWACARMKKDPPSSAIRSPMPGGSSPTEAIQYSEKAAAAGREAQTLFDGSSTSIRQPLGLCSRSASWKTHWVSSGSRPMCLPTPSKQ